MNPQGGTFASPSSNKDATTAYEDFDDSAIIKELYPDQERFKKEEQRRFELLLEHMDVPIFIEDFKKW